MSKVSYIELPPGSEALYKKGLQPGDRFIFSRIRVKDLFLSRSRVKGIALRSLLVSLAPIWQALTTLQKAAWTSAGEASGLTGWKQFVYDTGARKRAGISGYATPSDLYQAMVGKIEVTAPAVGLTIEQAHPNSYYIYKKVTGTRAQFSPLKIFENFGFPLELAISYKSALTATDGEGRARMFAVIYSQYQGRTLENILELPFDLSSDWQRVSASLSAVTGPVKGYSVFIEVHHARGTLYFDNVSISHSGENWARDPDCNNISQSFTKAYYQVAKHWAPVDISAGADFGSIYFT